eukprot:9323549-Alexandrium_andersonii.AAC.1
MSSCDSGSKPTAAPPPPGSGAFAPCGGVAGAAMAGAFGTAPMEPVGFALLVAPPTSTLAGGGVAPLRLPRLDVLRLGAAACGAA